MTLLNPMGHVWTLEQAAAARDRWRAVGTPVVFTNGHFDLLHIGHVEYLEQARALGGALIVGINGDASTRRLKGPGRPIVPAVERALLIAALACVNGTVIFESDTASELIAALRPDWYVKGGDYAADTSEGTPGKVWPERALALTYGAQLKIIPYRPDHSTSALIARIRALPDNSEPHIKSVENRS